MRATATEMRECLSTMSTIGEIEVFIERNEYGLAWLVRFYAEGDPTHMGPQPPITVNASLITLASSSLRVRRLQGLDELVITTTVTETGTTPFAEVDDAELTIVDDYQTTNGSVVEALSYTPPVHICGNGIRSTAVRALVSIHRPLSPARLAFSASY